MDRDAEATRAREEERDEVRFRMEVERAARERQQEYSDRWRSDLEPLYAIRLETFKAGLGFAQTALRSAFLLNGGALVALPTFTQLLAQYPAAGPLLQRMTLGVGAFVVGLVFAALASLVAHFACRSDTDAVSAQIEVVKLRLNIEYGAEADRAKHEAEKSRQERRERARRRSVDWLAFAAALLAFLSLVAFIAGAVQGGRALTKTTADAAAQHAPSAPAAP